MMRGNRRLLPPILTVVGFLGCVYAAFFLGVKQDFPVPPGAEQRPVTVSQQNALIAGWPQVQSWQTAGVNLYQVREQPSAAASFYTKAFHNQGWQDAPDPGQPKDAGSQNYVTLAFSKNKQQLIVAVVPGASLDNATTPFGRVLKSIYTGLDNLAIIVSGTLR